MPVTRASQRKAVVSRQRDIDNPFAEWVRIALSW